MLLTFSLVVDPTPPVLQLLTIITTDVSVWMLPENETNKQLQETGKMFFSCLLLNVPVFFFCLFTVKYPSSVRCFTLLVDKELVGSFLATMLHFSIVHPLMALFVHNKIEFHLSRLHDAALG